MTRSTARVLTPVSAAESSRDQTALRETTSLESVLVQRALKGHADAMRKLVSLLRPAVQAEVGWTLQRFAPQGRGRDARQELADMVQEVFLALFDRDGRILRAWDPARGRSLQSFVKLIARHQVVSLLRSSRRSPWTEEPTPLERLELETVPSPERSVADADEARRLVEALREDLNTRSMLVFEGLYVEDRSVEEVCAEHGMSKDALYAWRNRFKKQLERVARKLGIGADREG